MLDAVILQDETASLLVITSNNNAIKTSLSLKNNKNSIRVKTKKSKSKI
jgi:hypothetical protein